jgi:ABC-type enterobactin transport system permease subunit
MHAISQAIGANSLNKIRYMDNDAFFFCIMFILVAILLYAEVLQILELKNLFRQSGPIANERLYLLKIYVFITLLITTLVAIMLSARDVIAADLNHSIDGTHSDD